MSKSEQDKKIIPKVEVQNKEVELSTVETSIKEEKKYSKSQILDSTTFIFVKDLVNAILEEEKKYTKEEVNKLVGEYLGKEVK